MKSSCNTIGGPIGWTNDWKCQFPFKYDGDVYNECIENVVNREKFSWCSTKVTKTNRRHVNGNWAECSRDCKCKTISGPEDWSTEDKCQLPFEYSGKEYNGCIEYDLDKKDGNTTAEKGMWCSTKVHSSNRSHIHGQWAQCSEECPIEEAYTTDDSEPCTTLEDPVNNCEQCKFPFVMEVGGTKQNGCITLANEEKRGIRFWCPTQLDDDMQPKEDCWKPCAEDCNNKNVTRVTTYSIPEIPTVSSQRQHVFSTEVILITAAAVLALILSTAVLSIWKRRRNKVRSHARTSTAQGEQPILGPPSHSVASENESTTESTLPDLWIPEPIRKPYHIPVSLTPNDMCYPFNWDKCQKSTSLSNESEERTSLLRQKPPPGYVSMLPSKLKPSHVIDSTKVSINIDKPRLSGNPVPYNPKREVDRSNFTLDSILGSGNFGKVFKGIVTGLFYPTSKTCVAIKTIHNASNQDQVMSLVCEAKILSNLDLHLNLVNLLGSCTSNFAATGDLWLLLEYCQEGDMKSFLQQHRGEFINNIYGTFSFGVLNCRLFLRWAYDIAKGMEYLAQKAIMHGDLAARNVLICSGIGTNADLVAKVSDFGLAKNFYDNVSYKKKIRKYAPWKWMALEYLEDGCFTLTSDVWSYGVVIWEIFSLGKEPYPGKNYDEMAQEFRRGYYLPCPEEIRQLSAWPAKEVYNQIVTKCFVIDSKDRSSFKDLVRILINELDKDEKTKYDALTTQYHGKNTLIFNNGQGSNSIQTIRATNVADMNDCCVNIQHKNNMPATTGYLRMPPMRMQ